LIFLSFVTTDFESFTAYKKSFLKPPGEIKNAKVLKT